MADALFAPRWELLIIYPVSTAAFYALYFGLRRCIDARHHNWSDLNKRIFRQNICATVHTFVLILLLILVLIVDGNGLQQAGLRPFYSPLAYVAIGMSLGYMSLTLPWSLRMYFGTARERAATRPTLIVHHAFVVVAELVYLLTLTSPWHGSLAFVLFEFSNLFLMPHHLMTQLDYSGKWHFVNGLLFFVSCTFVRVLGCIVLGLVYLVDVITLGSSSASSAESGSGSGGEGDDVNPAIYVPLSLSLISFFVILALSIYWYVKDVLAEVHKEFQKAFGSQYLTRTCPCLKLCSSGRKAAGSLTRSSGDSSRA